MADPQDLGFSEFVAKLISETFTAVVDATIEQERRYGELAGAASLSLEEFASTYIDEGAVDAALPELFPPPVRRSKTGEIPVSAVDEGQPYFRGSQSRPESPPLLATLGLTVTEEEAAEKVISAELHQRIRTAVAVRLARDEWLLARAVVARGVPRVMVDSGHIMAKQTYQIVDAGQPAQPEQPQPVVVPPKFPFDRPTLVLHNLARPTIRPDLLILINSPRPNEPASQNNIYGEVQVTFKTVP